MCFTEGLHTQMSIDRSSDARFPERNHDLWWTIYSLDRQLSTSLGVPPSMRNEDVTASLGLSMSHQNDNTFILKTKLSQLVSTMSNSKYALL